MKTRIITLKPTHLSYIEEISGFLVSCFREFAPTWVPDINTAKDEIEESFSEDRISRIVIDDRNKVLGWLAAIQDPHVWEVHPIAVRREAQRKGIGALLVKDVSSLAKSAGAVGIWAGTGDETGATSLSSCDLYTDPVKAMSEFTALQHHPSNFWLKMGFKLVGILPDEEGLGKPGVHFSKRL